MTIEETIEAIKVMQAYVDGKEIQFNISGRWVDVKPDWDWCNTP